MKKYSTKKKPKNLWVCFNDLIITSTFFRSSNIKSESESISGISIWEQVLESFPRNIELLLLLYIHTKYQVAPSIPFHWTIGLVPWNITDDSTKYLGAA